MSVHTRAKSIAVVGAGPSGLVTCKELLQEGHTVTCFEETDSLGGVFAFRRDPHSVGVWESCRLTSSILVTSFSDYFPNWRTPVPFEHRQMQHHEYIAYLTNYSVQFDVLSKIRFHCRVSQISRCDSQSWYVTVTDSKSNEEQRLKFDAVAVCSGIHRIPCVPNLPGLTRFRGHVLHAANYKNPSSLKGKSALFIGAGESGELIAEASRYLDRSFLSLRRGVFVIPRLLNDFPNDYTGTRLLYSLPDFLSRRTDAQAQTLKRRIRILLFPVTLLRAVVIRGQQLLTARSRNKSIDKYRTQMRTTLGNSKANQLFERQDARAAKIKELIEQLRANAGGNQFETFATKTEAFVEAIIDGRCELRPSIARITPEGAVFSDGTEVEVDSIVLCTGYREATVPCLSGQVDLRRLYKNCFDPRHGETLCFIGFVRPPLGSIPPMAELQARWYAKLLSGVIRLPSAEEMDRHIQQELAGRSKYHRHVFTRLPHLVDFSTYMDDLAERIGCKPRLVDFLLKPRLLYKLYTGAFCGVQYRFRGPHSNPEMAGKVMLHCHSHAQLVRFLDLGLAQLARLIGLASFQPHLSLIGHIRKRRELGPIQ